jgi:hypothetical protein
MHISICGTHYIAVWFLLVIGWLPEALAHFVLMLMVLACSLDPPPQPPICSCTSVRVFSAHQSATRALVKHGERGESCRPRARTAARACHVHAVGHRGWGCGWLLRGVGSAWSLGRVHRSIAPHSASIYASVVSEVKSLRHRTTATSIRHPQPPCGRGTLAHGAAKRTRNLHQCTPVHAPHPLWRGAWRGAAHACTG